MTTGGYGSNHVRELLAHEQKGDYRIAGVVDPFANVSPFFQKIKKKGIPIYTAMDEFYQDNTADYVCISSPFHFHAEQTITALKNGSGVLCEKPLAPTVQEGLEMLKAQKIAGKPVGIGFQWSFSKAIQSMKKDILKGVFGDPIRLKTLIIWPRDLEYYNRNNWAGKIKDSSGNWILDSVASNATAHYLHNMFYILGPEIEESISPIKLQAELYRANNIENYDTVASRIFTNNGVELLYLATHASNKKTDPIFLYEFEKGVIYFDQNKDNRIIAKFKDGRQKIYGDPYADSFNKIQIMMDAVREQRPALCGIKAALPHLMTVNAIQEAVPEINRFPQEMTVVKKDEQDNEQAVYVEGLSELFLRAYKEWKLPHELGVNWTSEAGTFDLCDYDSFPTK